MGRRLRIGAYLWKRPDRGDNAEENNNDNDNNEEEEEEEELESALRRNRTLREFQRAREFAIPGLLGRGSEVEWPSGGGMKEELEWVEVDEKELSERLEAEEGNLREKDIDGIIEAEAKRTDGEEMLDSFKATVSSSRPRVAAASTVT